MSLMGKAKKKAPKATKASKGTTWELTEAQEVQVKEVQGLAAKKKALDAKMKVIMAPFKALGDENYATHLGTVGVNPETPMKLVGPTGVSLTYVAQDRSGQAKISDEQVEALGEIVGEDTVDEIVGEETTFSFSRLALENPEVLAEVDATLTALQERLVESGLLPESVDLLEAESFTRVKPGVLGRLPLIVGRDVGRIEAVLDVLGSACTRYVKT